MKSVQIRSFFWSVFSFIRTEYGKIRTKNNSVFGQFSHIDKEKTYEKKEIITMLFQNQWTVFQYQNIIFNVSDLVHIKLGDRGNIQNFI